MTTIQRARRARRSRRGSALLLTLLLTFALGGLAVSAIYMAGGTTILSKLYDRERDYRYAAEWALAVGKSRITYDTTLHLPDSLYVQLMSSGNVTDAQGNSVPKVKVDLYAGVGGSSTGEYGRFIELVAVAWDNGGARHVRRLELQAENFARYAMFTDKWAPACYTTGEIIRGRAHSNQNWQSCSNSPGPTYTDTVSAVTTITGTGQFQSAKVQGAAVIPFPTVAKLAYLASYAASANLSLTPQPTVGSKGGTRMEFTPVDLDGDGTFNGAAEGYFRVFDALAGTTDTNELRASTPNGTTIQTALGTALYKKIVQNQCGLNYSFNGRGEFVPVGAHDTTKARYKWLVDTLAKASNLGSVANAKARLKLGMTNAGIVTLMNLPTVRCYPAGDPHLMLTERPGIGPASPNDTLRDAWKRGGEDTTFTAVTKTGAWRQWPGWTGTGAFTGATVRQAAEEPYLWPVHRTQNLNSKGVIYVNGDIYLSGVLRGRVTLYVSGEATFIDDLTYVTNPASLPICQNLLGIITGSNMWIADNDINRPRNIDGANIKFLDDNQDFFLHAVTLVGVNNTSATFTDENYGSGPNAGRLCTPVPPYSAQTSGGCINQSGGVIIRQIAATFAGNYTGFAENRVKDACLDVDSPPYFPLTGRYLDNLFYEIDPQQFSTIGVANFYRRLQSGP